MIFVLIPFIPILIIILFIWVFKSIASKIRGEGFYEMREICGKCNRHIGGDCSCRPSWRAHFHNYDGIGDTSMCNCGKPMQYHDWMRNLEYDAQRKIAGCNSPPNIMQKLYG